MVEKYMKNLRELILRKMEEGNYTVARFADECGVSGREISKIKNGEAKNIRFDVLVKICENSGISYVDIFESKKYTENNDIHYLFSDENVFLIVNGISYKISVEKRK